MRKKSGPPPKPSPLRVLDGSALPKIEAEGTPCGIDPPSWLGKVAKIEWRRIAKGLESLGLLKNESRTALAAYCEHYELWRQAKDLLKQHSPLLLVQTPNGAVQQSPYLSIVNRESELMHKYMTEFGMTPASLTRIGTTKQEKKDTGKVSLTG